MSGWITARANEAQSNAWQHADHVANGRATWDYVNTTFVKDIRLGHVQEIQIWRGTAYRDEPHYVITACITETLMPMWIMFSAVSYKKTLTVNG
ncbi:hypothetical protein [Arsenophonus sp. PmNCSU2021_1]|uniref:hypothetical protein n=1 Tax=Arsenophonus sp. PmNCSU2021_1 TaxID=3118989 RepID=UPI002FEFA17D